MFCSKWRMFFAQQLSSTTPASQAKQPSQNLSAQRLTQANICKGKQTGEWTNSPLLRLEDCHPFEICSQTQFFLLCARPLGHLLLMLLLYKEREITRKFSASFLHSPLLKIYCSTTAVVLSSAHSQIPLLILSSA